MSSYYDRISAAWTDLSPVLKIVALVIVRDEWKERLENQLSAWAYGKSTEAEEFLAKFKRLSGKVDDLTSREGIPEDVSIVILLADFHRLAHDLGSMRIRVEDEDGDEVLVFDNPPEPQGHWVIFIEKITEVAREFYEKKKKGDGDENG